METAAFLHNLLIFFTKLQNLTLFSVGKIHKIGLTIQAFDREMRVKPPKRHLS